MKRRRSSIVLISLVFGTGREALGSELERLIAPKLLRGGVTSKPEEMDADLYSQHMHKGIKIEPRIVGGSNVDPNVYPFFTRIDTSGFPYCGGSLVAPDVVLTAGHCYTSDDALSVVVNGTELYYSNGPFRYKRDVDYSVRHPGFNPTTYENDAMLLKLSSPVSDVQYISINFDNENPQVGDDLTVMGLGNKQEDGAPADTLQAVTVQAIAHDICKAAYTAAGLRDRVDEEIMLCAGNFREGGRDVRKRELFLHSTG
jgi:secreted trypsin-like serine protease